MSTKVVFSKLVSRIKKGHNTSAIFSNPVTKVDGKEIEVKRLKTREEKLKFTS